MDKSDKDDNGAIVKLLACIDGRGRDVVVVFVEGLAAFQNV